MTHIAAHMEAFLREHLGLAPALFDITRLDFFAAG